jgi:hypothetical protein
MGNGCTLKAGCMRVPCWPILHRAVLIGQPAVPLGVLDSVWRSPGLSCLLLSDVATWHVFAGDFQVRPYYTKCNFFYLGRATAKTHKQKLSQEERKSERGEVVSDAAGKFGSGSETSEGFIHAWVLFVCFFFLAYSHCLIKQQQQQNNNNKSFPWGHRLFPNKTLWWKMTSSYPSKYAHFFIPFFWIFNSKIFFRLP